MKNWNPYKKYGVLSDEGLGTFDPPKYKVGDVVEWSTLYHGNPMMKGIIKGIKARVRYIRERAKWSRTGTYHNPKGRRKNEMESL